MNIWILNENKMLRIAQVDTTTDVELWTVGTSVDTTFKFDTVPYLDLHNMNGSDQVMISSFKFKCQITFFLNFGLGQ